MTKIETILSAGWETFFEKRNVLRANLVRKGRELEMVDLVDPTFWGCGAPPFAFPLARAMPAKLG